MYIHKYFLLAGFYTPSLQTPIHPLKKAGSLKVGIRNRRDQWKAQSYEVQTKQGSKCLEPKILPSV